MTSRMFEREALRHVDETTRAMTRLLEQLDRVERWGRRLALTLGNGGRLLAAGNGGSAAHAQHVTSELVGRYRDERMPLSAIAPLRTRSGLMPAAFAASSSSRTANR